MLERFPAGGTYAGRTAVLEQFFPALLSNFTDFKAAAEAFLPVENDKTLVLGSYRGRSQPEDNPFTARFAHLWTVRDGRLSGFEQIADTASIPERKH